MSSGNPLPTPVVIGIGGRMPPTEVIENDASNVETGGVFDPVQDGIDFYESLEGMRLQVNNAVVVGPTNGFGEIWVLADNGANATSRSAHGGVIVKPGDFNPERIQIDDDITNGEPQVNVGDTFGGAIIGVLDYNFANFELQNTQPLPGVTPGGLTREVTGLVGASDKLTIATFNVENLDPTDGAQKFDTLADRIVNNLRSPDIINVEEIQDNNGAVNDSTVDASVTIQTLISAIVARGGPTYDYRQIDPVDDQDGGEPGGNIRVVFLFNPARVQFVDRPGGTSTSNTTVVGSPGAPQLSNSPGRIQPTDPAFTSSRKPLAGEFTFNGQTVFAIANHFNSKGGDEPLFGPHQPPTLNSEVQRQQQATIIKSFVQSILALDPNARIVVAGDLNDFEYSNPLATLQSAPLTSLVTTLPANERYSYVFEGNSQTLDHILVSQSLLAALDGFDIVHINSEFAVQSSDHDPSVTRLTISAPATATPTFTPTATATATPTPLPFPATGAFVIGDGEAAVGNVVTFWSSQWAQENTLSGGQAPNSFKGFAPSSSPAPPACGGTFVASNGDSGNPPSTVPSTMAVIVTDRITGSGGQIKKIVLISTDPGYGPSPGHDGTGHVVPVVCQVP